MLEMTGRGLESVVADSVYGEFVELAEEDKKHFCEHLRQNELRRLSSYNKLYGGETYALWFHMMRTDNICIAMQKAHQIHPFSENLRVLDVGSGTGAGVMAVAYWMEKTFETAAHELYVACIEPAEPMRKTANSILNTFVGRYYLIEAQGRGLKWTLPRKNRDLRRCAIASATHSFDLVLFCHTFGVQSENERNTTKAQVVQLVQNQLKASGAILFLTPHVPTAKIELMEDIKEGLIKAGFSHYAIDNLPSRTRWVHNGTTNRQQIIIDIRHQINQDAVSDLNLVPPFKEEDARNDLPYYSFSGRIDIFERGSVL